MQANITFQCNNLKLPIHYNHMLQGFIYKNIFDDDFREFLHEKGFEIDGRNFKLFSFSQLKGEYFYNRKEKTITFKDRVKLTVSSPVDDFNNEFLKSCLFSTNLQLNHQPIVVQEIDIDENKEKLNKVLIQTLSPITVYSTVQLNGRKRTIYYTPEDSLFSKYIKENIIKKAKIIYGEDFKKSDFKIEAVSRDKVSENLIYFKKFIVKGWSGLFKIEGDEKLINTALDCGLGAKNSQGFGCIKLLR
ncbi:MAG TPA: CRISPR-associated endoribonuclease Cas6 [Tissierellia bacterium]|nr:CRISPR-associated endoribonuclease Cas6 [Tissierellia bacterium]